MSSTSNIDKVKGLLEAFHHLYDIDSYDAARQILFTKISSPTHEELHNQLYTWGYYQQRIYLYKKLLGKRGNEIDALLLQNLGNSYDAIGAWKQATSLLNKALKTYQNLSDYPNQGFTLCNLDRTFTSLSQHDKALDCYQEALTIAEESQEPQELSIKMTAFGGLGNIYSRQSNYRESIDSHEKALCLARELKNRQFEGISLGNIGTTYCKWGRYTDAKKYFEDALGIAQEIPDPRSEGQALGNLATIYGSLGQYEEAVDYLQKRLEIASDINDILGKRITLRNLGYAYSCMGDFNEAFKYLDQGLKLARSIGDILGEANLLCTIGINLMRYKEYDKSLDYLHKSLKIRVFWVCGDK